MISPLSDRETGTVERLVADLAYEAMRFFVWAAGEGISPHQGEPAEEPETTLFEFACATGDEDYDSYADKFRAELTRLKARADAAEARAKEANGWIASYERERERWIEDADARIGAAEAKLATAREALEQTQAFLERLIAMASGGADMSDANLAMNMNAVLDLIHAAITEGADHERS